MTVAANDVATEEPNPKKPRFDDDRDAMEVDDPLANDPISSNDEAELVGSVSNSQVLLPMEVVRTIVSFCSMGTLIQMRLVNKTFRDDIVRIESGVRYGILRSDKETSTQKDSLQSEYDYSWGHTKSRVIEKAVKLARETFFKNEHEQDDADDANQPQPSQLLLADGYDEVKVKKALEETGVVFHQSDETNFWRVEIRHREISLAEAVREMQISTEGYYEADETNSLFLPLMTGRPGSPILHAECEVAILPTN
ncbi:MAG: hypothetical protein SGARI_001555 [Bacillariaceae sp.]